ncbi:MAG: AAA family ATPase [Paludibacteraceae bacterium]
MKKIDINNMLGGISSVFDGDWLDDCMGALFFSFFGELPCSRMIRGEVKRSFVDALKSTFGENEEFAIYDYECFSEAREHESAIGDEEPDSTDNTIYRCYVVLKKNLMLSFFDGKVFVACSNSNLEDVEEIRALAEHHVVDKRAGFCNLHVVTYQYNEFDLEKTKVKNCKLDVNLHYNDDFLPVSTKIEEFIKSDRSGLVILHGKQGSGKTTFIRHLINMGACKMIYMGGDMVGKMADPDFINFVRKQRHSVFIVEDCEELLASRTGNKVLNVGLVNILNMSDGLLSDDMGVKFICTFNAPLKDIDEALLRKGRLVARYEFGNLTVDKVNKIIEEENLNVPHQTRPMTLAELYNYEDSDYSISHGKIGF